jgi:hypothetical protein
LQAKAAAVRPAPAAAPERRPADAGARRPPRPPACVQAKSAGAARGPAFGRAGLKPFAPPPLVGSLNDVVQLVMAYRVERESKAGGGYRVQIKDRKIVSLGEEKNISISFGTEAHSEHFLAEHGSEKPRLVKWEMNDVFWNMIKYKKGFGKKAGKKKGQQALESLSASKRPSTTPGGSDGASLDSFTKKTALTFYDDWYGVILSNQVPGTAREEFPTSEEEEPVTSAAATTTTPAPKAEAKAKPKAKAKAKAKAKPKAEAKMKPAVVGASSSSSSSSSSENWELINCSDGSQVLKGTREDMLAAQKEMGDDFMALAIS